MKRTKEKREKQTKTTKKKLTVRGVIAFILFMTLVCSVGLALIRFILAPEEIPEGAPYEKVKSDYLLMLTQCALGLAVMALPTFCTKKLKLMVPNAMCILYYVFLYCAIFLGEIFSFYYLVPRWDLYLHAMSGAMLGALGFILVDWLNKDGRVRISLSPLFVSIFAFSFALAVGALWEIYEFAFDSILGLNMQKFRYEDGTLMIGKAALNDTMEDIIIDAIAAATVAIIGAVTNIRRNKKDIPTSEPSSTENENFAESEQKD
jgi:hypothetical protein